MPKILTINSWKGDGDYPRRLRLLEEGIRALNPDLVLVQEVLKTTDGTYHTLQSLQAALGFYAFFSPMRRKVREIAGKRQVSDSGMGMLSRYPWLETTTIRLPSNEADGGRVGQKAVVAIDGKMLLLGNLHLSFLPGGDALRTAQLEHMLKEMGKSPPEAPGILGGDFNAVPHSAPIQFLLSHRTWEARDAFTAANGLSMEGITLPSGKAGKPGKRIDYLFVLGKHGLALPRVLEARVVLDQADESGTFPSDHHGLMATFTW